MAMPDSESRRPAATVEWAMKVREVLLRAMSGELQWWEAAEIVGGV